MGVEQCPTVCTTATVTTTIRTASFSQRHWPPDTCVTLPTQQLLWRPHKQRSRVSHHVAVRLDLSPISHRAAEKSASFVERTILPQLKPHSSERHLPMIRPPPDALFRDDAFQERGKRRGGDPLGESRPYVGTNATAACQRSIQCRAYSSLRSTSLSPLLKTNRQLHLPASTARRSNSTLAEQHFKTTLRAAHP